MEHLEESILCALAVRGGKDSFVRSDGVIGDVVSKYCEICLTGDEPIYNSILALAKARTPLIKIIPSDSYSRENVYDLAYRYTKLKLKKDGKNFVEEKATNG